MKTLNQGLKFQEFLERRLKQAIRRPAGADDGVHDGSTDVSLPLISKCSQTYLSLSLVTTFHLLYFFPPFPSNISLILGKRDMKDCVWTAATSILYYPSLYHYHFLLRLIIIFFAAAAVPRTHICAPQHKDTSQLMMSDCLPHGQGLSLGLSLSTLTGTWQQVGRVRGMVLLTKRDKVQGAIWLQGATVSQLVVLYS